MSANITYSIGNVKITIGNKAENQPAGEENPPQITVDAKETGSNCDQYASKIMDLIIEELNKNPRLRFGHCNNSTDSGMRSFVLQSGAFIAQKKDDPIPLFPTVDDVKNVVAQLVIRYPNIASLGVPLAETVSSFVDKMGTKNNGNTTLDSAKVLEFLDKQGFSLTPEQVDGLVKHASVAEASRAARH